MCPYTPDADKLQKNAIEAMRGILDYRSYIPPESESRNSALPSYIGLAVSAINFVKYASQLTTQTTSRFQVRITNQTEFSLYIYKTHMRNVSRPKYELVPGQTTIVDVSNLMTEDYKLGGKLSFAYIDEKSRSELLTKDFTLCFNYHEPDVLPFLGIDAIYVIDNINGDEEYKNPYCTAPYPPQKDHPYISFWAATLSSGIMIYANHVYSDTVLTKNVTMTTLELIIC